VDGSFYYLKLKQTSSLTLDCNNPQARLLQPNNLLPQLVDCYNLQAAFHNLQAEHARSCIDQYSNSSMLLSGSMLRSILITLYYRIICKVNNACDTKEL